MWSQKKKTNPVFPDLQFIGQTVLVRPPREEDWPQWKAVREQNYDYLQPFEPLWPDNCLTERFYERSFLRQLKDWNEDKRYCFLIFDEDDETLIGGVNVNNVQRGVSQTASFGYWLAEDAQGRGYMVQALDLIIYFCFKVLKLHRVQISCMPHNTKSIKVAQRLGFTEEGFAKKYIKINDIWEDHKIFGLTIEDWLESSKDGQVEDTISFKDHLQKESLEDSHPEQDNADQDNSENTSDQNGADPQTS